MKGIGITNRFKNNPSQIVASAPCFGEHNREVLQEFGYTDKEIDDLYKKGEIVTWTPADTAAQGRVIPTYRTGCGSHSPSAAFYISKGETNG